MLFKFNMTKFQISQRMCWLKPDSLRQEARSTKRKAKLQKNNMKPLQCSTVMLVGTAYDGKMNKIIYKSLN